MPARGALIGDGRCWVNTLTRCGGIFGLSFAKDCLMLIGQITCSSINKKKIYIYIKVKHLHLIHGAWCNTPLMHSFRTPTLAHHSPGQTDPDFSGQFGPLARARWRLPNRRKRRRRSPAQQVFTFQLFVPGSSICDLFIHIKHQARGIHLA